MISLREAMKRAIGLVVLKTADELAQGICTICHEKYVGLALDCKCTNYGKASAEIRGERGAALVMALMALMLITVMALALMVLGMQQIAISANWRDYTRALYAAEAGTESGVAALRGILDGAGNALPDQAALNAIGPPVLSDVMFTSYSVALLVPNHACPPPDGCITGPGRFSGNSAEKAVYVIRATAEVRRARATVSQEVRYIHNHSNGNHAVVLKGRWSQS